MVARFTGPLTLPAVFSVAMSVGKIGASTYVVPAVVVAMSWVLLGETPRVLAYLGAAWCLCGVAVSRRRPQPVVT